MGEPHVESYKVTRPSRVASTQQTGVGWYSAGFVATPHGVVGIYAQAGLTALTFAVDGREYRLSWARTFTHRRLITECKRLAERLTSDAGVRP